MGTTRTSLKSGRGLVYRWIDGMNYRKSTDRLTMVR